MYVPSIKDQFLIGFSLVILIGIFAYPNLFFLLPIMWPFIAALPIISIHLKSKIKTQHQLWGVFSWFIINLIVLHKSPFNLITFN